MDGTVLDGDSHEAILDASLRLPERQREALRLREREDLSYDEIAAVMETSSSSVAQLIARARINLYDELHGTALASMAPSPQCERALSLVAAREDGQLDTDSSDAAWLDGHLADCDRCRRGVEEMREAAGSYRTLASIGPAAAGADRGSGRRPRRRAALAAGLAVSVLLGGLVAIAAVDDPPAQPVDTAAGSAAPPEKGSKSAEVGQAKRGAARKSTRRAQSKATGGKPSTAEPGPEQSTATSTVPVTVTGGGEEGSAPSKPASRPASPTGRTAVEPTRRTSTPQRSRDPKPASTPAPAPPPAPAPAEATHETPAVEEPADEPPRRREPPGKPADRPPH